MEQELETKTEVCFDLVDRIKILFGSIPEITVKIIIPIQVERYNAVSNVKLIGKTKLKFSKDKPDYGYEAKI
jgi:hypothetical protein